MGKTLTGDGSVKLGLEGEGVRPDNFAVVPGLEFFHAFVNLMKAVADCEGKDLVLTGMQVVPGSAALALSSSATHRTRTHEIAREARLRIVSRERPPVGLRGAVEAARLALTHLPPELEPYIETQGGRQGLPTSFPAPPLVEEVTELRVIVRRVGGADPKVGVQLAPGDLPGVDVLHLQSTESLAQEVAPFLYKAIDAVVQLSWADENVVDSRLLSFTPVDTPANEAEVWREWFARAGAEWDHIDDVEEELRRGSA